MLVLGVAVVAGAVFFLRLFTWRLEVAHMASRAGDGSAALGGIEKQWESINTSIDEARREVKILKPSPSVSPSEVQGIKKMIENSADNHF